jgi:hypothetical protein
VRNYDGSWKSPRLSVAFQPICQVRAHTSFFVVSAPPRRKTAPSDRRNKDQ